jgi:iron complex outermembrane receptor protein
LIRLVLVLGFASLAWGQSTLADASLEQLLDVQVTSVAKKEQTLSRAAAAVFVIGQEDIRRSGARNLPDVLRMAPGVDVAEVDGNAWAISIRGFNSRYSNKVLVLVDGRSVYTPSFSGVYWDQLDMPLEDIERIEVIRGPGASVWGANAVNGVINIITKSSHAAKGGLATADGGTQGSAIGLMQYDGAAGRSGSYRAFSRYSRTGDSILADGSAAADGWWRMHGGFRSDWEVTDRDSLTVEGDLFANRESQTQYRWFQPGPFDPPFARRVDTAGGDLLATWTHTFAGGSDTSVRTYFDTYRRDELAAPESQKTLDLDFQHHFTAGSRHDVVWGLGYRVIRSGVAQGYENFFTPPERTDQLYSGFLQDEIQVAHDLWLTPGIRVEHNGYTGFEFEPSLRLAWAPSARQTFWASASRAIRQPSREETSVNAVVAMYPIDPLITMQTRAYGNPHFRSEELRDAEAGYRRQWTKKVSVDLAAFLGFYRHLETLDPQAMVALPQATGVLLELPLLYGNQSHATSYGGELAVNYTVNSRWRISPGYSFQRIDSRLQPGSNDVSAAWLAGSTPHHKFQIRSSINLSRKVEWDQTLYWYGEPPNRGSGSHARLDSRVAWRCGERTEFSIVGQNLLRPGMLEFGDILELVGSQAQRAVFGKVSWRF